MLRRVRRRGGVRGGGLAKAPSERGLASEARLGEYSVRDGARGGAHTKARSREGRGAGGARSTPPGASRPPSRRGAGWAQGEFDKTPIRTWRGSNPWREADAVASAFGQASAFLSKRGEAASDKPRRTTVLRTRKRWGSCLGVRCHDNGSVVVVILPHPPPRAQQNFARGTVRRGRTDRLFSAFRAASLQKAFECLIGCAAEAAAELSRIALLGGRGGSRASGAGRGSRPASDSRR